MELILRVVFSLLVVLGLMWFLARFARRPLRGRDTEAFSVVERRQLTRTASVAIVRVAGRALVLGITETNVTLLGEADLAALQAVRADTVRREPLPLPDDSVPDDRVPDDGVPDGGVPDGGVPGDRPSVDRAPMDHGLGERLPLRKLPAAVNGRPVDTGRSVRGGGGGRLAGSALSPQTWATAVEVLRARTVRRS